MSFSTQAVGQHSTRNLTVLYIVALASIALMLLVGYVFVDLALNRQSSDSHVINIAGRQRMLSQKLSKEAIAISAEKDSQARLRYAEQLRQTLALWEQSSDGLQNGSAESELPGDNSESVAQMFAAIEPPRRAMSEAAQQIIKAETNNALKHSPDVSNFVREILNQEKQFLEGMNQIVFQYDAEARARVERLKRIEILILFAVIVVLLFEGLYVFRPAVKKIRRTIAEIEQAKNALQHEQASVKLLQRIAVAANESESIEEAISLCLEQVCEYTGWSIGHAFLLADDGTGELISANLWRIQDSERFEEFRKVTEAMRFAPNFGLPGDVLASGKPKWISDVTEQGVNFPRAQQINDIGLKAGFAFPVLIGTETAAVLEFFSTKSVEPDEEILTTMAHTGAQLGRVIERKRAKDALQKEREFLSAVFDNVADGIVACDANGVLTFFNRATREFHGLPGEAIPGDEWATRYDLFMPDGETQMEMEQVPLFRALRDGAVSGAEMIIAPKNLPLRRIVASGRAMFDASGTKRGAVVGMHDVTERYQIEQSLRETLMLQRAILDGSSYMLISVGLDGTIATFNNAAEQMIGYAAAEVVGLETPALFHDFAEISQYAHELSAKLGQTVAPNSEFEYFVHQPRAGIPFEREWTIIRQDGTRFPALMSITATRDADGEVTGYLAVGSDVTERVKSENALRASEEKNRELVENASDVIYTLNLSGGFTSLNRAGERLIGYKEAEALEMKIADLISRADAELVHQGVVSSNGGELPDFELEIFVRNGGTVTLDISSRLIFKDDAPIGYQGIGRDVTERKKAEIQLKNSEEFNRSIFENSPDCVNVLELDGTLHSMNANGLCIMEIDNFAPLVGKVWVDFWAGEVNESARQAVEEARNGKSGRFEGFCQTAKGTLKYWDVSVAPIFDAAGQPCRLISTSRDITERRRAEEAMLTLASIVESSDDAIMSKTLDGIITSWNTGAERVFGYTSAEILGQHVFKLSPPELTGEEAGILEKIERGERIKHYETVRVRKDGKHIPVSLTVSPVKAADGKIIGISKIARDISEQKQIEAELQQTRDAALESARLKSEFLANMSHEIRTPMNGVIGMTGLLLDTELDEEQREFTETVRSSAESLLIIINDILDFSKIEAGKLRFEKLDFDLRNTVESTVGLLAERAQDKRIEIVSLVSSDVPTLVRGDAGRIRQVLLNLSGNAVKFTERGEVTVCATKENETEMHVTIRFAVTDTGIGISQDERKNLFQAFVQADGSTTRKYGGTGLGLAISKQIVEMMGGEIGVESEPDKGSTFWFVVKLEKQSAAAVAGSTAAPRADLHNLRVLIVDDNATNRKILTHQTASWGMIPGEAENGRLALESLRAAANTGKPFDVALLDYQMPEMNGFDLARAIKADEQLSAVRLVLMPSFGSRGDGARAREIGIAAYLMKPVKQSQLFDCLATVMGENEAADSAISSTAPLQNKLITRHSLTESSRAANIRILIAEDNPVNQKVAKRQVEKLGYQADMVSNGLEALDALAKVSYDIVLMDCQMPEMDGYAATAEIRRREGADTRTVVIAMTANAMQGDREKCLAAGMDDYIGKPIRFDEFQEVLERWINSKQTKKVLDARVEPIEDAIDMSVLDSFRELQDDGGPDLIAELVELYIGDTQTRLAEIQPAFKRKDASELEKILHSLKGSSGNLGIQRMAKICAALEENLKKESWNKVEAQVSELEAEFLSVRQVLENEIQIVNQ